MEQQALAIALEKSATIGEREIIDRLAERHHALMEHRRIFAEEAKCKRHARGEVYTAARVAAINAMGPSKAELDESVEIAKSFKSKIINRQSIPRVERFGHSV